MVGSEERQQFFRVKAMTRANSQWALVESARVLDHLREMNADTADTVNSSRLDLIEAYRLLHRRAPDVLPPPSELPVVRYLDLPDTFASTIAFR